MFLSLWFYSLLHRLWLNSLSLSVVLCTYSSLSPHILSVEQWFSQTRSKRSKINFSFLWKSLRPLFQKFLDLVFKAGGCENTWLPLHTRISKSLYLHGQLLPSGHFSPCPSGHCHLPSGSIPLYYRPPSVPHLNNSSPATPDPLRYCRHCRGHTHKEPQTAPAFINRWWEKEREAG